MINQPLDFEKTKLRNMVLGFVTQYVERQSLDSLMANLSDLNNFIAASTSEYMRSVVYEKSRILLRENPQIKGEVLMYIIQLVQARIQAAYFKESDLYRERLKLINDLIPPIAAQIDPLVSSYGETVLNSETTV